MATRACCSIAVIRSNNSLSIRATSKSATCCCTANCRSKKQFEDFRGIVTRHTMVHEQMTRFFSGFRRDAHPMAVMCGSVGALSAFYHDSTDINDPQAAHDRVASHDRENADDWPPWPTSTRSASRSSIRATTSITPRTSCRCASRCRASRIRSILCWRARLIASSSCTPTTSRTPRPRRCGWRARQAPIRSPASLPASPACGGQPTAAPTKPRSRCLRKSATVKNIKSHVRAR